jgi:hypothetical protein
MVKTCAKVYYNNCRNNLLCQGCTVTGGDTYLYSPIEDKVGAPCDTTRVQRDTKITARRKKAGRRSQKDGYEAERSIFQRLGGTHNPTSQGYDGTIGCLRVEYKVRLPGTKANSVLPTKAEWAKAVDQGNKLVIVEDKVTGEGTVTMSIETFESIREYL